MIIKIGDIIQIRTLRFLTKDDTTAILYGLRPVCGVGKIRSESTSNRRIEVKIPTIALFPRTTRPSHSLRYTGVGAVKAQILFFMKKDEDEFTKIPTETLNLKKPETGQHILHPDDLSILKDIYVRVHTLTQPKHLYLDLSVLLIKRHTLSNDTEQLEEDS